MMIGYGKSTQTSIAALSLLAQVYDGGATRLSASEIAAGRNLQRPFVAKLLTVLAQARLVNGSPGPGGGYALARPPEEITIYDVATVFEREDETICPLGTGRCRNGAPCPLHTALLGLNDSIRRMFQGLTLDIFRTVAPPPSAPWPSPAEAVAVHAE